MKIFGKTLTFACPLRKIFKKDRLRHEFAPLAHEEILKLEGLTMKFGGLTAVDNLSLTVKRGEIFGLIGPNGAGKTTVFNCITQFYKPTAGHVYYSARPGTTIYMNRVKVHDVIRHGLIRTFQNVELVWELTVLENLMVTHTTRMKNVLLGSILHLPSIKRQEALVRDKALNVLAFLGLFHYKDISPYGLPYGILKKIELARTLMIDPELIILDEPAAGLNDIETEDLAETIKLIRTMFHTTIFLVEHDMPLVMGVCDRVCAINFGKLLSVGTPAEIQVHPLVKEAYLGGD